MAKRIEFDNIKEEFISIHFTTQRQLEKLIDHLNLRGYDYGTVLNRNPNEIKELGIGYFGKHNQYLSLDRSKKYHSKNFCSCGKGYQDTVYEFMNLDWGEQPCNMHYELIVKDYVSKLDGKGKDYTKSFYRYNILDDANKICATVWFSQVVNSGDIYSVSVRLQEGMEENFNVYIEVDDSDNFYPTSYVVQLSSTRLTQDTLHEYEENLHKVSNIAETIMRIFEREEHRR